MAAVQARGDYRTGFALLLISALHTLGVLTVAREGFSRPEHFEPADQTDDAQTRLPSAFWVYLMAMALLAAGFADFSLVAHHLKRAAIAGMVPNTRRASAYGTFSAALGVAWFAGSALMRVLYRVSVMALVAFSVAMQLGCAGVLVYLSRRGAVTVTERG